MLKIDSYMNDGADWQSQAILAYVRAHYSIAVDASYYEPANDYIAKLRVGRYENCREQGYVFQIYYEVLYILMNQLM